LLCPVEDGFDQRLVDPPVRVVQAVSPSAAEAGTEALYVVFGGH
jgi:hypothetical protein